MNHFDYESMAHEAGLTSEQLDRLAELVRRDYPSDPMLFELHLLRACRAIRDRALSLEQAINSLDQASTGRKA